MDRYHCNVSLILLLPLLVVAVEIDNIALLVTMETVRDPSPSLYLHTTIDVGIYSLHTIDAFDKCRES